MSLAAVHHTNIVNKNSSKYQFQDKKLKRNMGSIMTCWKLMVASIFEFKSTYQRKINQPQTNQIPMQEPKEDQGLKKKLT